MRNKILSIALVLLFPHLCSSAEIIFKSGKSLDTKIKEITDEYVKVDVEGVEITYYIEEIQSINGISGINQSKVEELADLADDYLDKGQYQEAFNTAEKLVELDPGNPSIYLTIALALEGLKKHPESVPYFSKIIEMNPSTVEAARAYRGLANAYAHDMTKGKESVYELYNRAIEIEGPAATNQFMLGLTYQTYGECDKAYLI